MTIWIVRKHASAFLSGHLEAFVIVSTHATRAEAAAIAKQKNSHPNTWRYYSVGKVTLKETS